MTGEPVMLAAATLVVVVYDEDRPVPNLLIAPTARGQAIASVVGSHAGLLKTIEQALGLTAEPVDATLAVSALADADMPAAAGLSTAPPLPVLRPPWPPWSAGWCGPRRLRGAAGAS